MAQQTSELLQMDRASVLFVETEQNEIYSEGLQHNQGP